MFINENSIQNNVDEFDRRNLNRIFGKRGAVTDVKNIQIQFITLE